MKHSRNQHFLHSFIISFGMGEALCSCWPQSLHHTHLLKLHQRQSPHRRPVSSATPGRLSLPPDLLAVGPPPTPWRPESPAANTDRFIGVEVSTGPGYTRYYTCTLEGWRENKSWARKLHCDVFTFPIYYLFEAVS